MADTEREKSFMKIRVCFEVTGADTPVTGDHVWESTPWDAMGARDRAEEMLKELYPDASEVVGDLTKPP